MPQAVEKITELRDKVIGIVEQRFDIEMDEHTYHQLKRDIEGDVKASDPDRYDVLGILNAAVWKMDKAVDNHRRALNLSKYDLLLWNNYLSTVTNFAFNREDVLEEITEANSFLPFEAKFKIKYAGYLYQLGYIDRAHEALKELDYDSVDNLSPTLLEKLRGLFQALDRIDSSFVSRDIAGLYRRSINEVFFENKVNMRGEHVILDDSHNLIWVIDVGCEPGAEILVDLCDQVSEKMFEADKSLIWLGKTALVLKGIKNVKQLDRAV